MHLRCHLRSIRGKRKVAEIAEASGVAQPYLSQIEGGRLLPRDSWIKGMEDAYGEPLTAWYDWRGPLVPVEMDEA